MCYHPPYGMEYMESNEKVCFAIILQEGQKSFSPQITQVNTDSILNDVSSIEVIYENLTNLW